MTENRPELETGRLAVRGEKPKPYPSRFFCLVDSLKEDKGPHGFKWVERPGPEEPPHSAPGGRIKG